MDIDTFRPVIEKAVQAYDDYVYKPLLRVSLPVFDALPIHVMGKPVFTPIGCQLLRLSLVLPFMFFIKMGSGWAAFFVIILMDILDHLDGIIQMSNTKKKYDNGVHLCSFLDSFCDKVANMINIWTLLVYTDYAQCSWFVFVLFVGLMLSFFMYELLLAIIRVDDFYPQHPSNRAHYARYGGAGPLHLASSMEGKIKEKVSSLTLGFLALSMPELHTFTGFLGLLCAMAVVYLDHRNLSHKLYCRSHLDDDTPREIPDPKRKQPVRTKPLTPYGEEREEEVKFDYDVVYTIGCFDLFHEGHVILMNNLRKKAKTLVVGVHDDESIYLLKNRYPIDNQVKRIGNVRRYADIVYVIPSDDPTPYLEAVIDRNTAKNSAYLRGDDMPDFPGRKLVEAAGITIELLPYTQGVSSTQLRKELEIRNKKQYKQSGYHWIRWDYKWVQVDDSWIRYGDEFIRM